MSNRITRHLARWRTTSTIALLVVVAAVALSPGLAQGRVEPGIQGATEALQSADIVAKVTGGGTVVASPTSTGIASFGVNARRPSDFTGGGAAEGRINYNRHFNNANGRHVNVPVTLMQAATTTPPGPNGTGGSATLVGDCGNGTCPATAASIVVYVEDNADSGTGSDVFKIYFCQVGPILPPPTFAGGPLDDCSTGPEGGLLRSGNIQVRATPGEVGEKMATSAATGAFTTTPNLGGVELAGGTYAVGLRTTSGAGTGDVEIQLNGVSLIGMFQKVTANAWITSVSVIGGTWTLSGTCTLDMGDGSPPATGVPFSATLTTSGITATIGGTSLPLLPKADGFIVLE